MSEAVLSDQQHQELLLLYETAVAEIASFKQQQWAATYYLLIVHAGIVAIGQALIVNISHSDRTVLGLMVIASLILGLVTLSSLHRSITCRRTRLSNTRAYFGEPFKNARSVSKEYDPVPLVLVLAQLIGSSIAMWLVVVRLAAPPS